MKKSLLTCTLALGMMGCALAQSDNGKLSVRYAQDDESEMIPVDGTALTYYSGLQPVRCAQLGPDRYTLFDLERKIYVFDSSYEALVSNGLSLEKQMDMAEDSTSNDTSLFLTLAEASQPIINDSKNWTDPTLEIRIDSLMFHVKSEVSFMVGNYIYATILTSDDNVCYTDTVLVQSDNTPLHFAAPIETSDVENQIYLFLYDPEKGISKLCQGWNYHQPYNTQVLDVTDKTEDEEGYEEDLKVCGQVFVFSRMVGYQPYTDILWGLEKTMDYYKETFGLNSFDDQGTEVLCLCNLPSYIWEADNSCALPIKDDNTPGLMCFGMGGVAYYPVVHLETTAHEFTHLVARSLTTDTPDSDSCFCRALDESFADIMGLAVARWATETESWTFSEGMVREMTGLRCFDYPEEYDSPSCYGDEHFDLETYEVHTNAGVQNHMFYLLVTGGEGINSLGQDYSVTPINRDEAECLAFTVLTEYTKAPMTYQDAAEAWAAAASDTWGEGSAQLQSVMQAWAAVGLPIDHVTSISQVSHNRLSTGRRYNLLGQPVGDDYRGIFIER